MGSGEWEGASAVPCVGDPDRCITQRGCMDIACHEWPCTSLWSLKSMRRSLLQCAAVSSVAVCFSVSRLSRMTLRLALVPSEYETQFVAACVLQCVLLVTNGRPLPFDLFKVKYT